MSSCFLDHFRVKLSACLSVVRFVCYPARLESVFASEL